MCTPQFLPLGALKTCESGVTSPRHWPPCRMAPSRAEKGKAEWLVNYKHGNQTHLQVFTRLLVQNTMRNNPCKLHCISWQVITHIPITSTLCNDWWIGKMWISKFIDATQLLMRSPPPVGVTLTSHSTGNSRESWGGVSSRNRDRQPLLQHYCDSNLVW